MAATSMTMMVGGVANQTIGAYNKSKSDKAVYEYQSVVARNNAQLQEWQAQDAIERGQVTEQNVRMKTAHLKSTQRASMAARNLDLGEGSPLNILSDTDLMGELDAMTVRDNAAKEAWGLRVQAGSTRTSAALLKSRADAENPWASAAGTALTGAGQVASAWYKHDSTVNVRNSSRGGSKSNSAYNSDFTLR